MKGFTPISEKLGPDTLYDVMDQVYEILMRQVHDFGGTANEVTGDGIMALFGAPVALEEAPQRAIRASLSIYREMANLTAHTLRLANACQSLTAPIGNSTASVQRNILIKPEQCSKKWTSSGIWSNWGMQSQDIIKSNFRREKN
jgi:hypothetical protein